MKKAEHISQIKSCVYKCVLIILLNFSFIFPQQNNSVQKIVVTPGAEYEAGFLHEFFFGSHWRDVWTTPLEVEVLDLDKFEGGIVPIKKGGGFQTKSLQFKTKDGFIWKFRSINKDPKKVLPEDLRNSLAGDVIQDQISSSNPFAALVVVPLLNAVGVLQAEPKLIVIPDDEKLGEFRNEFAGVLGMIELHPDENEFLDTVFAGAEKISGTFNLLDRLAEKRDEKVLSTDFLKARLMDIFIGDWDRHTDQWRWAKYAAGDGEVWKPIPRDRDQAFAKLDGVLPFVARTIVPQLNHFDYDIPPVKFITWSGRFLDRRFLSELTKTQWDSVTNFVIQHITDEVIDEAVNRLPAEHHQITGKEIKEKLIYRRSRLSEISEDFFERINEIVEIYCTEKDDYIQVNRLDDEQTEVAIFKRDKSSGKKEGQALYHKIFDNDLTSEIRLYLLDGDDYALLTGDVNTSPLVRIIGDEGKDTFADSSNVSGYFLAFTPVPDAENKTEIYDSGKKTDIVFGSGTYYNDDEQPSPVDDFEKYEPKKLDRGHDFYIIPVINYDSDNGFILGAGPLIYKYNFRVDPYEYRIKLLGSYTSIPNSYSVEFNSKFYSLIKGTRIDLRVYKSELSLTKYFGYGNESFFSKDLEGQGFYELDREQFQFSPSIGILLGSNSVFSAGFTYEYSNSKLKSDTLIYLFPYGEYGNGSIRSLTLHSQFQYDDRDNEDNPHSGFLINVSASITPDILDVKQNYYKAGFEIRKYFLLDFITENILALRTIGEKLWGEYPFYESVFLGGSENLRGYIRERFSGDAGLLGQLELRSFLTDVKLILKGKMGLSTFVEAGRVFTKNIKSEKWHPSFGGGLWVSYLDRMLNITLTLAKSDESLQFYFGTAFMF
ncbi:MAG: BamA/TamA family outer membrane protein [Ignavibacteriales bacterium]|nr:MAG: BamA/TamA family outer membrane protein [Ignavibacteriales bacterium]